MATLISSVFYVTALYLFLARAQHASIPPFPGREGAPPEPPSRCPNTGEGGVEVTGERDDCQNNMAVQSEEKDSSEVESENKHRSFLGTCTQEEYYSWYYEEYDLKCRYLMANRSFDEEKYLIFCDKDCGKPYLKFLRSCGGSIGELYVDYYANLCHENSNGVPCAFFYLAASYLRPEYYVTQNCQLPYKTGTSCSLECFVSLHQMKYQLGCCLNNLYNFSSLQRDLAAYGVWNNCGVNTPGYCSGEKSIEISNQFLTSFVLAVVYSSW